MRIKVITNYRAYLIVDFWSVEKCLINRLEVFGEWKYCKSLHIFQSSVEICL